MSREICDAVFLTPSLSAAAYSKVQAAPASFFHNLWSAMASFAGKLPWATILQEVEKVILAVPLGEPWSIIIDLVIAALNKLLPTPAPVP